MIGVITTTHLHPFPLQVHRPRHLARRRFPWGEKGEILNLMGRDRL